MGPCSQPTDGKLRAREIHICSPHRISDQKDDLSTHSYIFLSNNHRGSNPPTSPTPKQKKKALLRYSFFFIPTRLAIVETKMVTTKCW